MVMNDEHVKDLISTYFRRIFYLRLDCHKFNSMYCLENVDDVDDVDDVDNVDDVDDVNHMQQCYSHRLFDGVHDAVEANNVTHLREIAHECTSTKNDDSLLARVFNEPDQDNRLPIHTACIMGSNDALKYLLRSGVVDADVLFHGPQQHWITPMGFACYAHSHECVRTLLHHPIFKECEGAVQFMCAAAQIGDNNAKKRGRKKCRLDNETMRSKCKIPFLPREIRQAIGDFLTPSNEIRCIASEGSDCSSTFEHLIMSGGGMEQNSVCAQIAVTLVSAKASVGALEKLVEDKKYRQRKTGLRLFIEKVRRLCVEKGVRVV